jgi:hypothetical protein
MLFEIVAENYEGSKETARMSWLSTIDKFYIHSCGSLEY